MGIGASSLFNGRSIGARLMKIQIYSSKDAFLSVTGCSLRIFILIWPAYLYLYMIAMPYFANNQAIVTFFTEISIIIFLIFVWPISIIWGQGTHGFHDLLLNTAVCHFKSPYSYDHAYAKQPVARVIGAIASTIFVSLILTSILMQLPLASKLLVMAESMTGTAIKAIHDPELDRLMHDISNRTKELSMNTVVSVVNVGWKISLNEALLSEIPHVQPNKSITKIPDITLRVGGECAMNMKECCGNILFSLNSILTQYSTLTLSCEREFHYDILGLTHRGEIIIDGKNIRGGEAWYPFFPMFSWSHCYQTVRFD
jgi:hypothetical protein